MSLRTRGLEHVKAHVFGRELTNIDACFVHKHSFPSPAASPWWINMGKSFQKHLETLFNDGHYSSNHLRNILKLQ